MHYTLIEKVEYFGYLQFFTLIIKIIKVISRHTFLWLTSKKIVLFIFRLGRSFKVLKSKCNLNSVMITMIKCGRLNSLTVWNLETRWDLTLLPWKHVSSLEMLFHLTFISFSTTAFLPLQILTALWPPLHISAWPALWPSKGQVLEPSSI